MQEQKKNLIDGLLGEQKKAFAQWGEKNLSELFKPIENRDSE